MAFNQLGPTVLNNGGAIDCAAGEISQAELDNLVVSFDLALTVDFDSAYLYLGSESGPDALILRMQANGANLRLTLTERENFTDSAVFTNQDIAYTLGATASIRVTHEPDNTYTVFVNDVQAATGVHANDTTAGSVALHFGFGGSGTATYSNIQAITAVPVIEYVGGAAESGYSSTATITHGLTILEGDFVLAYINRNDVTPIGNVTTGQQWIKARDQQPDGETAWQAVYHTVAGDSFPAVLNFDLGAAADYQVILKAFRPSAGKYIALGGVVLATNASKFTSFPMTASAGVVLPAKHASVIFGGKDRADNSTPSNTVDNGYTGVLGTGLGRASVAAHRLSNAPTTIAGNITVANTDNATADNAYSAHVTLVEVDRPQPKILGYELHTASADGSFAITVPDDATGIFVTVGGYSDGGASQLVDELSLANDNSLSFTQVIVEAWYGSQNGTTQNETLLLKSNDAGWSGTGAQTIYHSAKNGAYLEGHNFIVWYAKDFDLVNPIIDTDHSHGDAGVNPWDSSLTGMTASDMHVLPTYRYNGGFSLDINDQTEVVQVPAFNGAALTLAYKYGVDSMQVASSSTVKTAFGLRGANQTATIGNTDILGSAWGWTPGYNARSHFAAHTAGASEAIAEFHLYGSGNRAFNVFAFRADTGEHLGSGVVNISGSAGWHSVTGLNIALPAGVEVRIAFEEQGTGGSVTLYRASSTGAYRQASSAVAPDPWVDDSVYNYDFSFYAVVGGADAVVETTPSKEFVWNLHAGTLAAITDKTINNANGATANQTFAGLLDYNDGTDTGFDLTILKAVTPNSNNSNPVGDAGLNQAIFEEGGYASDGTYPGVNTITIDCPVGVTSLDLELFHNTTYNSQTDLDVDANGVTFEGHSVTGNAAGTTILLEGVVPDGSNQVVINYTQNTSQFVYGNGLRVFNVVEGGGGNTPVENNFSLSWNAQNAVDQSNSFLWGVLNNVAAQSSVDWDLLNSVLSSRDLSWALVESVNSELEIEWSIFNAVANSLQIDWDALNTVLNNRLVRWNIFNDVLGGLQIDWEVLSSLTGVVSTLQTDWNLLQAVTNQAGLDWSILSTAQNGTQLRFNVLNQLSNNLDLNWSLLATVNNTAQLNWSIEDQLGKVSQSASVSWGILTTINKQLSTHYDVLQAVGVSSQMRWDIAQAIQTEIQTNWSILQGAENGVSLTWDSIALVDGGLQLAWTIQTETIRLPMHQMIIQGENRVMTILDLDRIMTIH